jgi:hypothetical protein
MSDLQSEAPRATWHSGFGGFMLREWPYLLMLTLAVVGVAYTSFVQDSLYWVILTPLIGLICIATGWPETETREHRVRLVVTQALHWGAVLVAMELMSLQVTRQVSGLASALGVLTLLALGTFTAGLHMRTWKVAAVGVVLGISVPAIAFLQQSALLILLILAVLIAAIAVPFFWSKREPSRRADPLREQDAFDPVESEPPLFDPTATARPAAEPASVQPTTAARPVPQPPLYETPVSAPIPMPPPAPAPNVAPPTPEPDPTDTRPPPDNVRNISGAR